MSKHTISLLFLNMLSPSNLKISDLSTSMAQKLDLSTQPSMDKHSKISSLSLSLSLSLLFYKFLLLLLIFHCFWMGFLGFFIGFCFWVVVVGWFAASLLLHLLLLLLLLCNMSFDDSLWICIWIIWWVSVLYLRWVWQRNRFREERELFWRDEERESDERGEEREILKTWNTKLQ